MNVANQITFFRILIIPFLMYFVEYDSEGYRLIALILFIIASISDFLDGYIARKCNMVTKLGALLDPLADKFLIISVYIVFVGKGVLWDWAVFLIIARELAVSIFRAIASKDGIVISADLFGKLKTTIQIISVIVLLLNDSLLFYVHGINIKYIVFAVSVIVSVLSGLFIFYKYRDILKS